MQSETAAAAPVVYVVHCVDTEGPLEEPLDATFERINSRYRLDLSPSRETLAALQRGSLSLGGIESDIARFIAPERLAYLSTWREIEEMVGRITARPFRDELCDSRGGPYRFTWFVIDVVGYENNPRRKAAGFHVVWDHYQRFLAGSRDLDTLGWHFHTVPAGGNALDYNTAWTQNDFHERVLARRVLERQSFPSVFRAGGTIERDDLSHWLERFIPFDFSSAAVAGGGGHPGVGWDWRHAPADWAPYHPDWYDYRQAGTMRRAIFRCLEVSGFETVLTPSEVDLAFGRAARGHPAVLAYTNHDRRDMEADCRRAVSLIRDAAARYPSVEWVFASAVEAARAALDIPEAPAPQFALRWEDRLLWIESDQPLFGSIPFLAVHEVDGTYFRDNPTIEGPTRWAYSPPRFDRTQRIGVAGSNRSGATGMATIERPL
jgi:hypothetical protein